MTTKSTIIFGITVLLAIMTYLAYPRVRTFFATDSCLDQGGRWNYQKGNCDIGTEPEIPTSNFPQKLNTITFPCAIFVRPNLEKIEKLKKENPEDYSTIVDDNEFYMATSGDYLDSVKLKRIEIQSAGSISFKATNGTAFEIDLDSIYWGIILFNGNLKPLQGDITYINGDYESYMKK